MPVDAAQLRTAIQEVYAAPGQRKADKFETEGVTIRARKPSIGG